MNADAICVIITVLQLEVSIYSLVYPRSHHFSLTATVELYSETDKSFCECCYGEGEGGCFTLKFVEWHEEGLAELA